MRLRKPEEVEAGGALTTRGGEGRARSGGLKDGEWVQRLWHYHHVRISNSTTYRDNPNPTLKRSPSASEHNYGSSSAQRSESHPSCLFAHLLILLRAYVFLCFASMTGRLVNCGAHVSMFPSPSSEMLAKAASSSTSTSLSMEHTTSKSALAEAQARTDNEIALLKLSICALLTRRNALLPVSRLPYEILATIFLYQAYYFYEDPRYSGMWGSAPPWANVSYVCRHWRSVALSCPSLWSFLFVSSPRGTEELLSRSKTVPLRIRIDGVFSDQEAMILFEKYAPLQPSRRGILSKLSTPAPLLHKLRLCMPVLLGDGVYPDTLFNRETPALRTLELYHCHIPWSSPIFTALSTLRLRNIASSSQPTMTELLAMLRHMPGLAHLYLENALRSAKDALTSQHTLLSEYLDLPHLSRLALVAPFSAVAVFLSNVTIPLKTEIRLFCYGDFGFTASCTSLYLLLERRFNTTSGIGTVIRTLNIKPTRRGAGFVLSTSERNCDVSFYSEDGRHLHEDWDCCIPLKLEIDVDSKDLEHLHQQNSKSIIPIISLKQHDNFHTKSQQVVQ
ncbi:hypothetical protein BU15DRAFT_73539 [Melanogaster broomeanus]|nr:hypothetical protein BU15DRAFT_73539 [Melanogaster broomeanus]